MVQESRVQRIVPRGLKCLAKECGTGFVPSFWPEAVTEPGQNMALSGPFAEQRIDQCHRAKCFKVTQIQGSVVAQWRVLKKRVTMSNMNNASRVLSFSFSKIQMLVSSLILLLAVPFPTATDPRDFC